MSMFSFDSSGRLQVSTGTIVAYQNGLPFDSSGALVVANSTSAPHHFENGWPFDSDNKVSVDSSGSAAVYQNGLPYTSAGRLLANNGGSPSIYQNGLPVGSAGIVVNGLVPPVSDFFDAAQNLRDSYDAKYTVGVAPSPPTITVGGAGVASTINGRSTANPQTSITLLADGYSGPVGVGKSWVVAYSTGVRASAQGASKRFAWSGTKFDVMISCFANAGFGHFFRIRYSEDGGNTFMWGDTGKTTLPDDGAGRYCLVDFGSAAPRIIEVIIMATTNVSGCNFDDAAASLTTAPNTAPRVMMFGDSFVYGQGATFARDSMCYKTAEYLGILDCYNQGLRSNGFAHSSSGLQPYFHERMDWSGTPELTQWGALDLVCINGTLNDNIESTANIYARSKLAFQKIRTAQPNALIVFTMMTHSPDSRMDAADCQAYRDAFNETLGNDPGAVMLDAIAENWIPVGAIGSSIYFPAAGDTYHPNDTGHAYYGDKIGTGVLALADAIIAQIPAVPATGAWQLESSTDRWLLEDSSGVWLTE